jgi:hypothetical protein
MGPGSLWDIADAIVIVREGGSCAESIDKLVVASSSSVFSFTSIAAVTPDVGCDVGCDVG